MFDSPGYRNNSDIYKLKVLQVELQPMQRREVGDSAQRELRHPAQETQVCFLDSPAHSYWYWRVPTNVWPWAPQEHIQNDRLCHEAGCT